MGMTTASKTTTKTELMIDPTPTFYLTTETAKLAAPCGTRRRAARQKRSIMISEPFTPLSPTAAVAAPVDGGVLKCKNQKERIGRRGRRFRLLIMKKNDFR